MASETPHPYRSPCEALDALLADVACVECERIPLLAATGRVLAEDLSTDRPSPALDVSAMDGYAVRCAETRAGVIPVVAHARIGAPPIDLPAGGVAHIVTGAPIPRGADAVIKREDVVEYPGAIEIGPACVQSLRPGLAVRRRGENSPGGSLVLRRGVTIGPAQVGALASIGAHAPLVHRRVRIGVLVTGDELLPIRSTPEAWQLRDSNGPVLLSMLGTRAFAEVGVQHHAADDLDATAGAIAALAATCDTIFITGGVSMGDRDFVAPALQRLAARVLFHKLPQRPGRPVLAARLGKIPVLALPGNPVSVMVTARRLGLPLIRGLAGFVQPRDTPPLVTIARADGKSIDLWWHRPVRIVAPARAELVTNMGSGDVMGVASSDGFVEAPPGHTGEGALPYYAWA